MKTTFTATAIKYEIKSFVEIESSIKAKWCNATVDIIRDESGVALLMIEVKGAMYQAFPGQYVVIFPGTVMIFPESWINSIGGTQETMVGKDVVIHCKGK